MQGKRRDKKKKKGGEKGESGVRKGGEGVNLFSHERIFFFFCIILRM